MYLELILDALWDSIQMLPFLFLAYLLIEYIQRRHSEKLEHMLSAQSKFGPLVGAGLGCVPQCGFSAMAANLYTGGVITLGTLLAVFLSTSDEAIPVLLATPGQMGLLGRVLLIKIGAALVTGVVVDILVRRQLPALQTDEPTHINCHGSCCHEHEEGVGLVRAALGHTLHIWLVILAVSVAISLLVGWVGEDTLSGWLSALGPFQLLAATIVGLLPNCTASVLLTQLYLEGSLTFGAMVAGLCASAGVGLLVLVHGNKDRRDILRVVVLLVTASILTGLVAGGLFI